ncbi:hypothetical protein Hypma_004967 [Hypsizygus marmoreus]|uniref:BTB domain-containing protein n=1 Tax=Hypsizygus marmoreus TaxID=39966 RepID=A0A369K5F0_HYPMA|nr:hypothetical protein Hypma_004967 [Hypsizygus marmoreus]
MNTSMEEPTRTNSDGTVPLPQKDEKYYFTPIVFQVDDCLFKVPKFAFCESSTVFSDMLAVPQPSEGGQEGSSAKNPVKLHGVSKDDFRRLLEVMYPLDIPPSPSMSQDGWIAVLSLSQMWEMYKIRSLAIDKLTAMPVDSIRKIKLAKQFHVPQWLRTGYLELVNRNEMLSMEEAEQIDYVSAIRVFQVREEVRPRNGYYSTSSTNTVIERVFKEELEVAQDIHHTYSPGLS